MVIYNSDGKPRWASADKDSYEYFVKDGSLFAQGKFLHLTNAGEFAIVANGAHAYNKEAPKDALSKFFTIKSNDKGGFGIQHLVPYKYRTLVIVASVVVGVATVVATAGVAGEFFAAAAPEAALADAEAGMAVAVDAAEAPEVAALGIDLPEAGIVDEEVAEEVEREAVGRMEFRMGVEEFEAQRAGGVFDVAEFEELNENLAERGLEFNGVPEIELYNDMEVIANAIIRA
jgi:hypothetical protein